MSIRPLYKKLGLVKGMSIFLHAAPENYFDILEVQREAYEKKDKPSIQSVDFVHAFLKNREAMMIDAYFLKSLMTKNGILWISWPKSSSDLFFDLKRDEIREHFLSIGLVDVKVCSFNENWSGLKFVYRLKDR